MTRIKKHLNKIFYTCVLTCLTICTIGCTQNQHMGTYGNVQVIDTMVIDENSVPIFPKKAALTTDTARRFSIDLPKRCTVDWNNQNILSVVPEEKIEIIRLETGDKLPELQVSDYDFKKLTVKQALDKLLDGTDISVVTDGELVEKITGTISSGSLSDAVELMVKMGHVYYSYDEIDSEIKLTHRGKWLINLPKNENIIMALLDAMHGANLRNLLVNWDDKTVVFEGDYQTEREVAKIIADVASKKHMIAWDIDIYRV